MPQEPVRVYQGRVAAVEIGGATLANLEALWDHHKLFQDAVNYYLVALAALAAPGGDSPVSALRARMADCWEPFARAGRHFDGLRQSLEPYLLAGACTSGLVAAFAAVLADDPVSLAALDAAAVQLAGGLKGTSQVQRAGREEWPRLCLPNYSGRFSREPCRLERDAAVQWLPFYLHDPATTPQAARECLQLHWFANIAEGKPSYSGDRARERLLRAALNLRRGAPNHDKGFDRLEEAIKQSEEVEIPAYMAGGDGAEIRLARLDAFLLLKHAEASEFTLGLLRGGYPAPKAGAKAPAAPDKVDAGAGDPIRCARGIRGYVFRAFTALPCWGGDGSRPRWKEFDIAAFKEALKTLNQYQQQSERRNKQRAETEEEIAWMEQREGCKPPGARDAGREEERDPLPPLAGDPRWDLAKQLLEDLAGGEGASYGLGGGTMRGFGKLREQWRRIAPAGRAPTAALVQQLLDATSVFQAKNRDSIGSAPLFRVLTAGQYWPLWQEPNAEEAGRRATSGFAEDILAAHLDYLERRERFDRLGEPVGFTPADARHSRRQFLFGDLKGRSKLVHRPGVANGRCAAEVSIAQKGADGLWREARATLYYTAPRLRRDGLRRGGGGNLKRANWLQPMVAAFEPAEPAVLDFSDCNMGLMPDWTRDGER
ncbi:MAG: type V CRISPR-associated protein Cas12b, partial [Terriglobales bacterium]